MTAGVPVSETGVRHMHDDRTAEYQNYVFDLTFFTLR